VFSTYFALGFEHILPRGFDHVLFIAALVLASPSWPPLLWQVSAFTVAHALTLALAVTGLVQMPSAVVEPLIALSIVAVAVENIVEPRFRWRRPAMAFAFGLLHGLGFGSVMKVYLENADLSSGLIGITIGVELGHMAVLVATGLAAFAVQLALKTANKPGLYRPAFVIPVAGLIALVGAYWALQRVGLLPE
jgi:hypothetical protein